MSSSYMKIAFVRYMLGILMFKWYVLLQTHLGNVLVFLIDFSPGDSGLCSRVDCLVTDFYIK